MGSALRKGAAAAAMLALTSTGLVAMGTSEASAASSAASAVTCKVKGKKKNKVVCPDAQLRGPAGPQGPAGPGAGSAGVRVDYKARTGDGAKTVSLSGAELRLTCATNRVKAELFPIGNGNQVFHQAGNRTQNPVVDGDEFFSADFNASQVLLDPAANSDGLGSLATRDQQGKVSTMTFGYTYQVAGVNCLFYGVAVSS